MPQPKRSAQADGSIADYDGLIAQISRLYTDAQRSVAQAVNVALINTYWQIGRYIVEFEQEGAQKAAYRTGLLDKLSADLTQSLGRGFSRSNLNYMRLFYRCYPICEKASHKLSWSHYCELVKIDDPLERSFYEKQSEQEGWSVPQLCRQKKAALFLRLAASRDKEGILQLAHTGQRAEKPTDLLREPYILDFLAIPEVHTATEADIESRIISHLQSFLLELGKGFAFIGRQYRITLAGRHHYVDLVFYHRILKCFVLIDLKTGEAGYEDVGQMNTYLAYFEKEESTEGDNPPIGIVLAREKDEVLIQYATHGLSAQLFVQKYQLYLPDEAALRRIVYSELDRNTESSS